MKGSFNPHTGTRYYSFRYSDSIVIIDSKNNVNKIKVTSNYFSFPDALPSDSLRNMAFVKNYEIKNSKFLDILYDPYRDLVFRVLKHSNNYYNEDGSSNTVLDSKWSLLVMKNEKVIDEIIFDEHRFNYQHIAVIEDGLLISNNHDFNPINNGKMVFTLLKFH